MIAAEWSTPEIVAALLATEAKSAAIAEGEALTPLLAGAMRGNEDVAEVVGMLLAAGAGPCRWLGDH